MIPSTSPKRFLFILFLSTSFSFALLPEHRARVIEPPVDPVAANLAKRFLELFTPEEILAALDRRGESAPQLLEAFAEVWPGSDKALAKKLGVLHGVVARSMSIRLMAKGPGWEDREIDDFLTFLLWSENRFENDPIFRGIISNSLLHALDGAISDNLRNRVLERLNQIPVFDFDMSERLETAWRRVPRASGTRGVATPSPEKLELLEGGPLINYSFFSLPASLISVDEAVAFLEGLLMVRPERRVIVLTGLELESALNSELVDRVQILPVHGRNYSPWPRDPFTFFRDLKTNGLVILNRPDRQKTRESDFYMAREFVQGLPEDLDIRFGEVHWTFSETPFHNGKILIFNNHLWIDLNTLEARILELMNVSGFDRLDFSDDHTISNYFLAADVAARDLSLLYGMPVHFVNPMPKGLIDTNARSILDSVKGGAGFDLDSLVSLIPSANGKDIALVGDPGGGVGLAGKISDSSWDRFSATLLLHRKGEALKTSVLQAQQSTVPQRLKHYLDRVAGNLIEQGFEVKRLPLLVMPTSLNQNPAKYTNSWYIVGWNNVVLTNSSGRWHAEGFVSGLEEGDAMARQIYEEAGCSLDLVPVLRESVLRGGGYRCASKHLGPWPSDSMP